jgi:hypothetical protein
VAAAVLLLRTRGSGLEQVVKWWVPGDWLLQHLLMKFSKHLL